MSKPDEPKEDPMKLATALPKSAEGHEALKQRRFKDAELIFRELAADIRRLFGPDHIEMAIALQGLAAACQAQGKIDEAAKYTEQASRILLNQKRA
jgi:hypothetical protein